MAFPILEGSRGSTENGAGASINVAEVVGIVPGELLVITVAASITADVDPFEDLDGWTLAIQDAADSTSARRAWSALYWRVADGSEGVETISWAGSTGRAAALYQRWANADIGDPILDFLSTPPSGGNESDFTIDGTTSTGTDRVAVAQNVWGRGQAVMDFDGPGWGSGAVPSDQQVSNNNTAASRVTLSMVTKDLSSPAFAEDVLFTPQSSGFSAEGNGFAYTVAGVGGPAGGTLEIHDGVEFLSGIPRVFDGVEFVTATPRIFDGGGFVP